MGVELRGMMVLRFAGRKQGSGAVDSASARRFARR